MSNLRERASEIKDAAEQERGNFEPTGVPKRIYDWWLEESPGNKARAIRHGIRRENFCHFWRVVLIWAPLMALAAVVLGFVESTIGKVVLGVAAAAIFLFVIIATGSLIDFLAIMAMATAAILLGGGIGLGLYVLFTKFWKHDWDEMLGKVIVGALITAIVGGVVFAIVAGIMEIGWILLAYIAGGLVGAAAIIALFVTLANVIAGRRAIAKRKKDEAENDYYAEHGEFPRRPRREPSAFELALGRFFSGLADFMILITQVVRVKKWKICPLVEVEPTESADEYYAHY